MPQMRLDIVLGVIEAISRPRAVFSVNEQGEAETLLNVDDLHDPITVEEYRCTQHQEYFETWQEVLEHLEEHDDN